MVNKHDTNIEYSTWLYGEYYIKYNKILLKIVVFIKYVMFWFAMN